MLFGIPDHKDEKGSQAYAEDGVIQRALWEAKKDFPIFTILRTSAFASIPLTDTAGCLKVVRWTMTPLWNFLAKSALSHVQAGADMVAPSDMMDGRVGKIRTVLDAEGYEDIPIMSYAVKYASGFYAPFRDAAKSAPAFGDRKTYQMDYHNSREGIKEILLDEEEGADIVMVKPALAYLDMIAKAKEATNLPIAAYSVSGEYAMIKAAAEKGWILEDQIVCETAVAASEPALRAI